MNLRELIVSPGHLWGGEVLPDVPCLFVDASESLEPGMVVILPPCPVIAIGREDSALAMLADAVVPDDGAALSMLESIRSNPGTAAIIVELLRILPGLSVEQGLVAESLAYGVLQASEEHARWLSDRPTKQAADIEGAVRMTREDSRLDLLLDRPAAGNAIDRAMRDALCEAFRIAAIDPEITRVILRGAGRTFSLGAELGEFGTTRDPAMAHHIRRRSLPALWAARCADKLEVHVHGACVGAGLEIAAFARRLTAGPRAWFHLPEMSMGVLPGAGGCVSLTRRIGRQNAARLILSGKRLSAREALALGLVDAVVDDPASDDGRSNMP